MYSLCNQQQVTFLFGLALLDRLIYILLVHLLVLPGEKRVNHGRSEMVLQSFRATWVTLPHADGGPKGRWSILLCYNVRRNFVMKLIPRDHLHSLVMLFIGSHSPWVCMYFSKHAKIAGWQHSNQFVSMWLLCDLIPSCVFIAYGYCLTLWIDKQV